ncbi:MAG: RNA 2',3'-cyclic phosphodiesterase [Actinomycetota bacterium]|nr:RNA 2',3'-cyclic phosphodiesterase [Actinomycetota bacterium]
MNINENKLKKRLFVAIELPEDIRCSIYKLAINMFENNKYARVVAASNIHLTLKFLGDTEINKIEKIKEAIKAAADQFEKFNYKISGAVNAFPDPRNARIVFLEVDSGGEQICKIYNELEDNLSKIKIKREKKKFSPHVTIVRMKNRENINELIASCEKKINAVLNCKNLTLFESQLRPEGARYTILDRFSLK